jgi:hypothetical protein
VPLGREIDKLARKKRIELSRDDLEAHLEEQMGFIRASAEAYDEGHDGEAKRLAVNLRVLLHDSRTSHSLLGQLGMLGRKFLSTAMPSVEGNVSSHHGLVMIAMKGRESTYVAMLDDVPYKNWLTFEQWWEEVIFVDKQGDTMTRRDLVTVAANQDGGAHVDPGLDETYERLAKRNSLGWTYTAAGETGPIPLAERAAIRQVAHELLVSLTPGYEKKPALNAGLILGSGVVLNSLTPPPMPTPVTPGRNDRCPCGSGLKYKKCHGKGR